MNRHADIRISFHGTGPFDIAKGKQLPQKKMPDLYRCFCGNHGEAGEENTKLVGITAAMKEGTGLVEFEKKFPSRCLTWNRRGTCGFFCCRTGSWRNDTGSGNLFVLFAESSGSDAS